MNWVQLYEDLITKAKEEGRQYKQGTYFERHHIIPRCLGGEGQTREWKTHPNIVLLTAKEHLQAHLYLARIHQENPKLWYALWILLNRKGSKERGSCSSLENYSSLYEEVRLRIVEDWKERPGAFRAMKRSSSRKRVVKVDKKPILKKATKESPKPLQQLTIEGCFVRDWNSVKQAARELSLEESGFARFFKGRHKSYGGYIWKFVE